MPYSTQPTTGAGSTLYYEDASGNYVECPWMTDMGELGDEAQFFDATPLRSSAEIKYSTEAATQEKEFKFVDVPGDSDHEDFIDMAKAQATVNMRTILSNGRQMDYPVSLGRPKWATPTRGEKVEVTVPYSKSGDITHSQAP